jgi:hypothetical protein
MTKTNKVADQLGDAQVVANYKKGVKEHREALHRLQTTPVVVSYPAEFDQYKNNARLKAMVESEEELKRFCDIVVEQSSRMQEEVANALTILFRLFGKIVPLAKVCSVFWGLVVSSS